MKPNYRFVTTLSLAFLPLVSQMVLFPQEVSAAQQTVILGGVKGEVIVKKGGGLRELPAVEGMELVQGDWLRTGKTGTAKLIYENGTEATIGASSSLNIQQLTMSDPFGESALSDASISSSQTGRQSSLQLWAGSIWSKVKSLMHLDDEYDVETPTAVMGVRGTLYLVSVNPDGATQGDVIDGVVGVSQNQESTQAAPIQLVTMGRTMRLISLAEPLPNQQVISPQDLIKNTQPEILVQLMNDIAERTNDLVKQTKEQQLAFGQTGDVEDIKTTIGMSFKLNELASFGKEFMNSLRTSDKLEEVKKVLQDNNQSIERLQTTLDATYTETEKIKSEIVATAKNVGVSQEQIDSIGNKATGAPSTPASVPPPGLNPPIPPSQDTKHSNDNLLSSVKTVTSSDYTVSAGTITNVPYGLNKETFLSKIAKGENHQSWDTTGVDDPVASNNTIVVTAQDGTQTIYTILVAAAPDTEKPVINLTGSEIVSLATGSLYYDAGAIAVDNIDGTITERILTTVTNNVNTGTVLDTSVAATYTYHYNVSDTAGNVATEVTRIVVVEAPNPVIAPLSTGVNVRITTPGDELDTNGVIASVSSESLPETMQSDAKYMTVRWSDQSDSEFTVAHLKTSNNESVQQMASEFVMSEDSYAYFFDQPGQNTLWVQVILYKDEAGQEPIAVYQQSVQVVIASDYNEKPQITFSIPDSELYENRLTFSLNKLMSTSGITASKDSVLTVSVDGVGTLGEFNLTAGQTMNFLTASLPENSSLASINLPAVFNAIKSVDEPTKDKVIAIVDFYKLFELTTQIDPAIKESIIRDIDFNNLYYLLKNTTDLSTRHRIFSNITSVMDQARSSQGFRKSVFIALYPALNDLTDLQFNKVLTWELEDGGKFTSMLALFNSLEFSAAQENAIFSHINYTVLFNAVMELEPSLRQSIVDEIDVSALFEVVKSSNTEAKEKIYVDLLNVMASIEGSSSTQTDILLNTIAFQDLDRASLFQVLNNLDGDPNDLAVTMKLTLRDANDDTNTNLYTVIIQP